MEGRAAKASPEAGRNPTAILSSGAVRFPHLMLEGHFMSAVRFAANLARCSTEYPSGKSWVNRKGA